MLILFGTLSALSTDAEWGCGMKAAANPADKSPLKGCFLGGKLDQSAE